MNVALLGARGYTGSVLLKILLRHPHVQTIIPYSLSTAGEHIAAHEPQLTAQQRKKLRFPVYQSGRKALEEGVPEDVSAIFSALPHGVLARHCPVLMNSAHSERVLIDLSADFRLKDRALYQQYYAMEHPNPALLAHSCYGLSEWHRNALSQADIIANPGCYPTSALLPLLPVLQNYATTGLIHVHSISGISGAGKALKQELLFCERDQNIVAYKPGTTHRHYPEMQQELCSSNTPVDFLFTPHLAPVRQGIFTTIIVPLPTLKVSRQAAEALHDQYSAEPFVHVTKLMSDAPNHGTATVLNTNTALIYTHCEKQSLVLYCTLDNLWKGAAGQAAQNFNIRFGFEETAGLL